MARHHVISTTACDVFFKLVAHQKSSLGAHFDSMIVTFSADGRPVQGATLRNALWPLLRSANPTPTPRRLPDAGGQAYLDALQDGAKP